jgi:hypothetical protein
MKEKYIYILVENFDYFIQYNDSSSSSSFIYIKKKGTS